MLKLGRYWPWETPSNYLWKNETSGADPWFFLGGGAVVSWSTSTPINHIVFFFFWQNTSSIRKPQVISGGTVRIPCTLPLHSPLNMLWTLAFKHQGTCSISNFQVTQSFCFKSKLSAKLLIWKRLLIILQIKQILTRKVFNLALF